MTNYVIPPKYDMPFMSLAKIDSLFWPTTKIMIILSESSKALINKVNQAVSLSESANIPL
jgi:hypothetical protein